MNKEEKEMSGKIADKETTKAEVAGNKSAKTTSQGEYSDAKKASIKHMKEYYGEESEINDDNYTDKMEKMVSEDYGPSKKKLKSYDETNRNILAMMDSEPDLSGILSDMGKGAKFAEALPKYVDVQSLAEAGEGGDIPNWEENRKCRMKSFDERQSRLKSYDKNLELAGQAFASFIGEKGLEGPQVDEFAQFVAKLIDDASKGSISNDFLQAAYYAKNYQSDVLDAAKQAEIKAKNEKIEVKMKTDKDFKGDGTADISTGSSEAQVQGGKGNSFAKKLEKSIKRQQFRIG